MQTTVTINGITQTIELTKEQMELFKSKEFGRVKEGKCFYYISAHSTIQETLDSKHHFGDSLYITGNYFLTEEKTEREAKVTSLRRRMIRFSDEHGGDSEWDGENKHWYIACRKSSNRLELSYTVVYKEFEKVYFNSEEVAQLAIEKFKDELMELV